tara:strand:+ start:5685 stop:5939 length:255 start_codon:yes stop_codon:yes gene_type:complete
MVFDVQRVRFETCGYAKTQVRSWPGVLEHTQSKRMEGGCPMCGTRSGSGVWMDCHRQPSRHAVGFFFSTTQESLHKQRHTQIKP